MKGYVRNKAHPEGSIVEAYLSKESMHLCARYLNDFDTLSRERNFDGVEGETCERLSIFKVAGRSISAGDYKLLDFKEHKQAHFYVLKNCEEVNAWVEEHFEELSRESTYNVERRHKEQFIKWFESRVSLYSNKIQDISYGFL